MKIKSLALVNFRSFVSKSFEFDKTTLLVGKNGLGKTSIIEAIYLLSSGNSFRAGKVIEMIRLGEILGRVKAKIIHGNEEKEQVELEAMLTRGEVQGKRTQYRLFSVNNIRRRKKEFIDKFSAVVFRPEDLRLVEGSPGRRRNFLDTALSQVSWRYQSALNVYEQALKKRNKLLFLVREGEQDKQILTYWNMQLIKHGEFVQNMRRELVDFLNTQEFEFNFNIDYQESLISAARINQYLEKEILVGHTLVGPHKDDFIVRYSLPKKGQEYLDINLLAYGSRGQQRLGVLWLKLGELAFVKSKLEFQPVLLLDDIMSELDDQSREIVLKLLERYQVVLTTADKDLVGEIKDRVSGIKIVELV
jgi:DNA replication and repair protein RecF